MDLSKLNSKENILPWLLVEGDQGQLNGNEPLGHIRFCMMRANKPIEWNPLVVQQQYFRCCINNKKISVKIVLAATERHLIDEAVEVLKLSRNPLNANRTAGMLLVQYIDNGGSLVHQLVTSQNDDIKWTQHKDSLQQPSVTIVPGHLLYLLKASVDGVYIEKLLQYLKCFLMNSTIEQQRQHQQENKVISNGTWMLVQYNPAMTKSVYRVIAYSKETVWKAENKFPNVAVYVADNEVIHQALVLAYSKNRKKLLDLQLLLGKASLLINLSGVLTDDKKIRSTKGLARFGS